MLSLRDRKDVIDFLRYNMRSQTLRKSLPMPIVIGALKRLEMMATQPQHKERLWTVALHCSQA